MSIVLYMPCKSHPVMFYLSICDILLYSVTNVTTPYKSDVYICSRKPTIKHYSVLHKYEVICYTNNLLAFTKSEQMCPSRHSSIKGYSDFDPLLQDSGSVLLAS